ncbi:MAG: hypothetical protein LBK99_20785, partial [Opitutaceae bacterium]|nr:hypothetical protein [Opitutaceae bacterium]
MIDTIVLTTSGGVIDLIRGLASAIRTAAIVCPPPATCERHDISCLFVMIYWLHCRLSYGRVQAG